MNNSENIKPLERIPATEAAKLLKIDLLTLYYGLQQGIFPFGFAVKKKQWVYVVYREKLEQYLQPDFRCNNPDFN